jgi:hypothetical protein
MPSAQISARETALQAFFALFAGMSQYPTKKRLISWVLDPSQLPALIQLDLGSTPTEASSGIIQQDLRVLLILGIRTDTFEELSPALSAARAEVLACVGSAQLVDGTQGGAFWYARWDGDEDPLTDPDGPPHAVLPMNFTIIMTESETNPYAAQ